MGQQILKKGSIFLLAGAIVCISVLTPKVENTSTLLLMENVEALTFTEETASQCFPCNGLCFPAGMIIMGAALIARD